IGVVEAWPAVDNDQRRATARAEDFVINGRRLPFKGRAVFIASQPRNSGKDDGYHKGNSDQRMMQTSARILIHKAAPVDANYKLESRHCTRAEARRCPP